MAASSSRMGSSSSSSGSNSTGISWSLQFHLSLTSSEENSLDPKTTRPNYMKVYHQQPPRVRIVGFKLPTPSASTGSRPVPPASLQRPGLCIRGPLGTPIPVEPIEKVRSRPRVRSLLTEALHGQYSYPEPPYSGSLWPQYQGLQICRTWI